MARKVLTDRALKSLKNAPNGKPCDLMDAVVPGLGIRILAGGRLTFVLIGRFPGSKNPTRRSLGEFGRLSVEDARKKARRWLELLQEGKDPSHFEAAQKAAEERKRENLVSNVAEDFIRTKVLSERKGPEVARDIRRDLIGPLGHIPITDVMRAQVRAIIKAKAQTAPAQARNLLGYAKRFFAWAVDEEVYGLSNSPCSDLMALKIIGAKPTRERDLSDEEVFAFWRATKRLSYPYREIYQMLLLNGLRLNEVADASKTEFDYRSRLWTIPKERMKARSDRARAHAVPLTQASLEILASLPTLTNGSYIFSLNGGKSPVWVGDKVKKKLDISMLRTLRSLARKRGENWREVKLAHFVNHDLRRTVRSKLSPLRNEKGIPISDEVKEAVLAHARPGVKGVYDKYDYLDEKQEALQLWAESLENIVRPSEMESNVTPIRAFG
jgi:integrase